MYQSITNRVFYADVLRILAALAVIIIHVSDDGIGLSPQMLDWHIMTMWGSIIRGVPLFLMISGMVNIQQYDLDRPMKTELKKIGKKILRIYCALLFWAMCYNIFLLIISNYTIHEFFANPSAFLNFDEIIRYPYQILNGENCYHLWFLFLIIGLYLLTPLMKMIVENCKRSYLEYVLIIIFTLTIGIPCYNSINNFYDIPFLPHSIKVDPQIGAWFGYYLAGYYFSTYKFSKKVNYGIYILGGVSILFTVFGTSWISITKGYWVGIFQNSLTPNIAMTTIAIFVFFKNYFANKKIPDTFRKITTSLAKRSFGIYLLHVFMMTLVNRYFGLTWDTCNPLLSVPLIALLVFLLSYLVSLGISNIPVLKNYIV